jgi:folate-binding protein YgfZ
MHNMTESLTETCFCPLDDQALIRVSGDDARAFLQSQLSNDVHDVSPTQSQLTSLNTPKGRTLALMRLLDFDGALLLALPRDLQAPILEHLRKYILRARVELGACNDEFVQYGMVGATALKAVGLTPPPEVDHASSRAEMVAVRVPGDAAARHELFARKEAAAELDERLAAHGERTTAESWRWLDTLAGIPLLSPATSGEFIAQMLNLDTLGAINFHKGCYPGQEIIARAHYRGQVKRRSRVFFRPEPARPGDTLALDDNASATVIQSVANPRRHEQAILAVGPALANC